MGGQMDGQTDEQMVDRYGYGCVYIHIYVYECMYVIFKVICRNGSVHKALAT